MSTRINKNQFNINFIDNRPSSLEKLKMGIFFAGGGGISCGAKKFRQIDIRWLLNHDRTALRTSSFHNKGVKVYHADVYVQDEHEMEPVDILQASIECDKHSKADTEETKDPQSYMMGNELLRYIPHLNPLCIWIENVPEFKNWAPLDKDNKPIKEEAGKEFEKWKNKIMDMGYEYVESIRNAADDGMPTRRVRFFCCFHRPGLNITFPEFTHAKDGANGKLPWKSCREHIDTENVGPSIFGRQFNESLPKHLRRPLVPNSLKRIAGGIKKQYPHIYQFIAKYYNSGNNPHSQTQSLDDPLSSVLGVGKHQLVTVEDNGQFLVKYHGASKKDGRKLERSQSLDSPINCIDTSNRHQLISMGQFVQDHCQTDNYQSLDEPLRPQLTWQTKQLITLEEKLRFIVDHCHSDKVQSLEEPLGPQTTRQTKQLATLEMNEEFIVQYYGGGDQSNNLDDPINTITGRDCHQLIRLEKIQFITNYFNSNGHPEYNNQSLDEPLSPVLGKQKHQLISILDKFDIRARFLNREELAACSTFPRDYFSHPELKLSQKSAIKLIGDAVPPYWTELFLKHSLQSVLDYKLLKAEAA